MRELHCCACLQHTFIIIFPSSVFIFSFSTVIPAIYRLGWVFFFFTSSCRTESDTRRLLTSICDGVCRVCSCYLSACTWITSHFSGTALTAHRGSCPVILTRVRTLLKPFMSTRREHRAETVSLDAACLPQGPLLLAKPQVWVCLGQARCVPPPGQLGGGGEPANAAGPGQPGNAAAAAATPVIRTAKYVDCSILLTQHGCWPASRPRRLLR